MATPTYTPIETYTLGSAASSVTFGSGGTIPQTYTDLILVCNIKSGNTNQASLNFQVNNSTTGNLYSGTMIYGNGSVAGSNRQTSQNYGTIMRNNGLSTSSTVMQPFISHFMNYSNTTTFKTVISRNNVVDAGLGADVSLWRSTSAINEIKVYADTNAFAAGSTFTLYGIANADIGAPKAQGGVITYDSTYYYHTFGASGTFIPQQSLTVDYLVIAGGGGAGSYNGGGGTGGGGAGGLRSTVVATGGGGTLESQLSLSATPYTITVGAGGSGASGYNVGTQGGSSTLSTITSTGGGRSTADTSGGTGGSGAGGYGYPGTYVGGAGTANQGYAGGNGTTDGATWTTAGGGGGAGGVGGNGNTSKSGDGGIGVSIPIIANTTGTGVATYYAGGGGGAGSGGKLGAAGGLGGGGTGANSGNSGTNGVTNTGSGGGGNGGAGTSGNGGSGVVIIRYLKA